MTLSSQPRYIYLPRLLTNSGAISLTTNHITNIGQLYWGGAFGDNPVNNKGLSRKHVIEGMSASLARLDLEYVDLIYAHRPDRQTPMEEVVRAFNHLITTGRAFYWGTSQWSADEIAQAWRHADRLGLVGPVMEQPLYNLLDREKVELEFAHLYRDVGLGLTVFSPLKQGLLSVSTKTTQYLLFLVLLWNLLQDVKKNLNTNLFLPQKGKYRDGVPADSRFAQEQVEFIAGYWKRTGKDKVSNYDLYGRTTLFIPLIATWFHCVLKRDRE